MLKVLITLSSIVSSAPSCGLFFPIDHGTFKFLPVLGFRSQKTGFNSMNYCVMSPTPKLVHVGML